MTESDELIGALDRRVERRSARREFFQAALGMGVMAGAISFTNTAANAQSLGDADYLNFALNLEYLEAQFYSFAVNGTGLAANQLTGTGTQGAVTGGQKAALSDPLVVAYAQEIVADEVAHVAFLRTALGGSAVAQPAINIGAGTAAAPGPFTLAARAAGLINNTQVFNPYADDNNFLLGAFIFEDVGVTAYKGAAPLISNATFLEAAAGILAVEAYHASIVRTALYGRGINTPTGPTTSSTFTNAQALSATNAISNARDSLDGSSDLDQGVSATGSGATLQSNIVPTDGNGLAYSRTPQQVLNIVYLTAAAATMGGFFPSGVNGNIRASVVNA